VRPTEQRRIRTLVPTVEPLRGSAGPRFRTCLADLVGARGSGLSKTRPRALLVSVFATVLGVLAFAAVPALASKPETPEVSQVIEINSSSAIVRGVLNPDATTPREAGTYQFVYRPSTTSECQGAGEARTPETPGLTMGLEREETPYEFIGSSTPLTSNTEYALCLIVTELGKTEPVISAAVSFKTLILPETPTTLAATAISGTSATLNGVLNPNKHSSQSERYQFFYRKGTIECQGPGAIEAPAEAAPATGEQAQHVSLTITGLQPDTPYIYCLKILNTGFEYSFGVEQTFTTPTVPPIITEQAIAGIDSTEATVTAEINPSGLPSTYDVEYEPGVTTPEASLPASNVPVTVRQRITSLQPGTQYHYRFIAHNTLGTTEGTNETFNTTTTIASTGSGSSCANATLLGFDPTLPDCRADELVSSATEIGEVYDPGGDNSREQDITTAKPFRAAADGSSVAYLADPGPIGGDGNTAKGSGNQYLARRGPASGPSGWETTNITPPVGISEGPLRQYEAFSPDLSFGIIASEGPLLAAQPSPQAPAGCNALYAHSDSMTGGIYQALFTETQSPGNCGEAVDRESPPSGRDTYLLFAGETGDHSQRFFQTPAALVAPALQGEGFGGNLYDFAGGGVSVVNRLPGGEIDPHATYGGPSDLRANGPDLDNAVSSDGSRVFWSTVEEGESIGGETAAMPVGLYGSEDPASASSTTVQLDAAEPGCLAEGKCRSGKGEFWAASSDGSTVFFTDCNKLTKDSTANAVEGCQRPGRQGQLLRTGNELYEYDFARPVGQRLADLTVDGDPLGTDVQGVIGASEDGSYVYFVAGGALPAKPNNRGERPSTRKCELAEEGSASQSEVDGHLPAGIGCNLYEEHSNNGEWEKPGYIAAIAARDNRTRDGINDPFQTEGKLSGDWVADSGARTAEVSADGRRLVFESTQELTGYDSSDVAADNEGRGGSEVFVYDADSGRLACASCNPTGAPPVVAIQQHQRSDTVQQPGIETGFAAYLPISSSATFMHRWMNARGSEVFFDSSQPLASGDSNGAQDVYEWETEGATGCSRSTSRYGGCVFLLSGGESPDWSFLADADESGENAFVVHRGPLGGAGPRDDKFHLYDVRVGGGFSVSSSGCTGTGCQGVPPAAPLFATPASVTFSGVGNFPPPANSVPKPKAKPLMRAQKLAKALRACRKKQTRARTSCEAQARRKYGATKAKRSAKRNRGAK
jgi:hypothetical protein